MHAYIYLSAGSDSLMTASRTVIHADPSNQQQLTCVKRYKKSVWSNSGRPVQKWIFRGFVWVMVHQDMRAAFCTIVLAGGHSWKRFATRTDCKSKLHEAHPACFYICFYNPIGSISCRTLLIADRSLCKLSIGPFDCLSVGSCDIFVDFITTVKRNLQWALECQHRYYLMNVEGTANQN